MLQWFMGMGEATARWLYALWIRESSCLYGPVLVADGASRVRDLKDRFRCRCRLARLVDLVG